MHLRMLFKSFYRLSTVAIKSEKLLYLKHITLFFRHTRQQYRLSELSGQSPQRPSSNSNNPNVLDKTQEPKKVSKQSKGCRSSTGDWAHCISLAKGSWQVYHHNARHSSTRLKYCDMRLSTKDPVIDFIK